MEHTLEKMRAIVSMVEKSSGADDSESIDLGSSQEAARLASLDTTRQLRLGSTHFLQENASFFSSVREALGCDEPVFFKSGQALSQISGIAAGSGANNHAYRNLR